MTMHWLFQVSGHVWLYTSYPDCPVHTTKGKILFRLQSILDIVS